MVSPAHGLLAIPMAPREHRRRLVLQTGSVSYGKANSFPDALPPFRPATC
jgi:hypothetical protein